MPQIWYRVRDKFQIQSEAGLGRVLDLDLVLEPSSWTKFSFTWLQTIANRNAFKRLEIQLNLIASETGARKREFDYKYCTISLS